MDGAVVAGVEAAVVLVEVLAAYLILKTFSLRMRLNSRRIKRMRKLSMEEISQTQVLLSGSMHILRVIKGLMVSLRARKSPNNQRNL